MKPDGRQRVSSVLTAEGQQGSTDEGDKRDDPTEAGRSVVGGTVGFESTTDSHKKSGIQRTGSEVLTE